MKLKMFPILMLQLSATATLCNRSSSNSNSLINNNSFSCSSSSNISFNTSVGSCCDNTSCKLKCVSVDHSYSKSSIYSDKLKLYIENTKSSIAELKSLHKFC